MGFTTWRSSVARFVRDHPRRVAAAAAALLAMLAAAWWSASQPGKALRAERVAAPPGPQYLVAPLTLPVPAPLPRPEPTGAELCGYGPVAVDNGIPQIPRDIGAAADAALGKLASALAARPSDRERALGLYLQMFEPENAAEGQALVRLATTTSDADAYALAIFSCRREIGAGASGDCALLSYAQWARIEPDNAVPWLSLADDAQQRGDRSSLEAALIRASKARFSDPHWDQISELFASDALAAQAPAIQVGLAIRLLGIQAALPIPNPQGLMNYCSTAAQADQDRVQTCGDLAARLIEHSRNAVEVSIGAKLAERVGWEDPRLAGLQDEADALRWQMAQMSEKSEQEDLLGCDSLARLRRAMAAQAQVGERGWLRQELTASGVTTAQAAERWRAALRERALRQSEGQKATR
jgi:hypothetical protein